MSDQEGSGQSASTEAPVSMLLASELAQRFGARCKDDSLRALSARSQPARTLAASVLLATLLAAPCSAAEPTCLRLQRALRPIRSEDHCAMAFEAPKVALLYLTRGEMPHEKVWRRWFSEVGRKAFTGCTYGPGDHFLECSHDRRSDPIAQQHLFSVRTGLGLCLHRRALAEVERSYWTGCCTRQRSSAEYELA